MSDRNTGSAPNYTTAALVMAAVNLIWIFIVIWAAFGFVAALLLAGAINHAISRFAGGAGRSRGQTGGGP